MRLAPALLFFAACSTLKTPDPGELRALELEFPTREFRHPSGIRVVVQADPRSQHVALVAVVGAGAAHDPLGREGLAHFVEHLAFRAEPEFSRGASMWRKLEELGAAVINGYTTHDATVYYQVVHKSAFERALALDTKWLLDPLANVKPNIFSVEREVVRNELRQRGEMAVAGEVFHELSAMLFHESDPHSRPVIGTHASLSAITMQDARDFAQKYYRPENITLLIAGDVDVSMLGEGIQAKQPREERREPPDPPAPGSRTILSSSSKIARPEAWIAWTLPAESTIAALVENELITRNLSSEILQGDTNDDITDSELVFSRGTSATVLMARFVLREESDFEAVTRRLLDALEEFWTKPTDLFDLTPEQQRFRALAEQTFLAEDLLTRALDTAWFSHHHGRAPPYREYFAAISAMSPEDVKSIAQKYLSRERARVLYLLPGNTPNADGVTGLASPIEAALTATVAPPALEDISELTREAPGKISRFRLENGLEVAIDGRSGGGSVILALTFLEGPETKPGERAVTREIASWRGRARTSQYEYGSTHWTSRQRDRTTWFIQAPAPHLANAIALLADQVKHIYLPQAAWEVFRQRELRGLRADADLPEERAERAFLWALFGARSYGRKATSKDLAALRLPDIERRLDLIYRPSNALLTITGAEDPALVEREVRAWFSSWSWDTKRPPPPERAPQQPGPLRYVLTDHPDTQQTRVSIGCVLDEADASTDALFDVLESLVAGGLDTALRQELGVTYGLHASAERLASGDELFGVYGSIEVSRLTEAVAVIIARWRSWSKGQVAQRAIDEAKWSIARRRLWVSRSSSARAAQLARAAALDGSFEQLAQYPQHLQAVNEAAVDRTLKRCYERLVISLEGPLEAIQRASRSGKPE
jgi:zinc protease